MKPILPRLLACLFCVAPILCQAGPVDINSADATTLTENLVGIGPEKAAAIIRYREANGPFKAPEDLANVKGIGARTVEQNRSSIMLGPPAAGSTD